MKWLTAVILALGQPRKRDGCIFDTSLSYSVHCGHVCVHMCVCKENILLTSLSRLNVVRVDWIPSALGCVPQMLRCHSYCDKCHYRYWELEPNKNKVLLFDHQEKGQAQIWTLHLCYCPSVCSLTPGLSLGCLLGYVFAHLSALCCWTVPNRAHSMGKE